MKPLTILIADDWPDSAESLGTVLGLHGHKVYFARNGVEAVEKAKRLKPDVALLDVAMPRMTGLEAAIIISEQNDKKPLLIALSGFCAYDDKTKAYKAGFDHFFAKPLDPCELLRMLELKEHTFRKREAVVGLS